MASYVAGQTVRHEIAAFNALCLNYARYQTAGNADRCYRAAVCLAQSYEIGAEERRGWLDASAEWAIVRDGHRALAEEANAQLPGRIARTR